MRICCAIEREFHNLPPMHRNIIEWKTSKPIQIKYMNTSIEHISAAQHKSNAKKRKYT